MNRLISKRHLRPLIGLSALLMAGCTVVELIKPRPPGPIQLDQKNYQRPLVAQPLTTQPLSPQPVPGAATSLQSPAQTQSAALYTLAEQHEQGSGVDKNMAMAFYLYLSAAEQNNVEAQIKVGEMLTRGDGIAADPLEGYKWWYIAAANNSQRAKALLNGEAWPLPEYDRNRAENLGNAWHQVRAERLANSSATN